MLIHNYNYERAEKAQRQNDADIKKIHTVEKVAFYIKSSLLILMNICIIIMSICVLLMLTFHGNEVSNTMLFLMVVMVAFAMLVVAILMPKRKRPLTPIDYYDNIETKYHRIINKYDKVVFKTNETNEVVCICEDHDRNVEALTLHPNKVIKSDKIKNPVLDLQYDCLWLPI